MRHIPTKLPQRGSATPRKSVEVCSVEGGCISPLELGVGGMTVSFGKITLTTVACSLILGILVNIFLNKFGKKTGAADESEEEDK